ncbi:hypothetical protein [Chelativorans sp. J32]|uniref:hypothetical protein n=1 Tax=Chelativorans sp. J32 TaxID=935840 RepID=UPI0012EC682A|nr:hypothetical protein [Chelativorans sp. J32]
MRKGGGGIAWHAGNGPAKIGLSEILPAALGNFSKLGINVVQAARFSADDTEEMVIYEGVKVRDQLRGCFTRQSGESIRSAARTDLNAVPQQSLAGRNRHDIEADKLDIAILAQPDAPGQSRIQGQLPFSGSKHACKKAGAVCLRPAGQQFAQCHIRYARISRVQTADYQQLVEMFQTRGERLLE